MKRFSGVALALALFLGVGAAPAVAAPAETFTEHYYLSIIEDPLNPCLPVLFGLAEVNGVFHETVNGSTGSFTNTETGNLVGRGPFGEILARYTFHFGGSFNNRTGIFTGGFTLSATGTVDGEPFVFNLRDKFQDDTNTSTANGTFTYNCHDGSGPQSFPYEFSYGL